MKIGFDAKRAFNNTAGLGNFSRNTIVALAHQNTGDQFYLFHPNSQRVSFDLPGNSVEIKPQSLWWRTFPGAWRSLGITKLAKSQKLDLYHGLSHELPVGIENSSLQSVVTIHDLIFLRYPDYFKRMDRMIYERKFRHACKAATTIHAISEQTKRDIIQFFGIPEGKIKVIYQSINPIYYNKVDEVQKQQLRQKYQLPEHFILTVGTVEKRKNLMAIVEGMMDSKIGLPLVVVGKPTDYQLKVQKFIERHQQAVQVLFLSDITDAELAVLYQMAEMMVYPSFFEGFGLPVAEAQASGCPVITSNTSSLPEVGANGAIYIDPEKPGEIGLAIESLVSDQSLKEKMVVEGKINARRFTPEKYAKELKQLYNKLLND